MTVIGQPWVTWVVTINVMKLFDIIKERKIIEKNGCLSCHSVEGRKIVGPSFKDFFGTTVEVTTDGLKRKVTVDEEYIKTSIFDPNRDIVDGFPKGVMKSYKGIIKEKDIPKIVDYLKTIKTK